MINVLKIDSSVVNNMIIVNSHKLPTSSTYQGGKRPPPIIVRFALMDDKNTIMKQTHLLKGSSYVIKIDLPASMKKQRSELESTAYIDLGVKVACSPEYVSWG